MCMIKWLSSEQEVTLKEREWGLWVSCFICEIRDDINEREMRVDQRDFWEQNFGCDF